MKRRVLLLLGVCCCLPAAAPAGVHIAIKNGHKVIFNDGAGSRPREALSRSDSWLASRVAIPSLYDGEISRAAREAAIDPRLVKSVMLIESAFNPSAVSRKGARGLMQLMPETAVQYGVRDALDPSQNISGGARHLARLLQSFRGDVPRSLAAYNAGEAAVLRYGGVPPYGETRLYVRKGLSAYLGNAASPDGFAARAVRMARNDRNRPLLTTELLRPPRVSKRS